MSIAEITHLASQRKFRRQLIIKLTLGILACLAVGYVALSAYAGHTLTTPKRIFEPEKAAVFGIAPEEVKFPAADGLEIAGWFIPAAASDKALILIHGRNVSRTQNFDGEFAEFGAAMQRRGFAVLTIDLRGHGQSADARCTFGLTERRDVIGAFNWLKQRGYQPNKIAILGVSLGAAAAVGAAADDPEIGVLVLDSGFAEIYPIMQQLWPSGSGLPGIFMPSTLLVGQWLTGYDLTSARPVKELERMAPRPILIIHSVLDPETPVEHAYQLRAAAPSSEYWETTAAKHALNYNSDPQEYVDKVADFLNRSL
ncbi:MAG TPA: alpha/beta fold hydrolase, partial [Anaerolineae bacterium]|nr:alpha/beta fold hydrolase [Anaerolineae bacterium]